MSSLSASFNRRQRLQRKESSSTIASVEAEIIVNQHKDTCTNPVTSSSLTDQSDVNVANRTFMSIMSSSDIKVGEHVTNIHHHHYARVKLLSGN